MAVPSYLGLLFIVAFLAFIVVIVAVSVSVTRQSGGSQKDNPSLRPCPDCGHYISVRANTCPQCGGPVKTTQ